MSKPEVATDHNGEPLKPDRLYRIYDAIRLSGPLIDALTAKAHLDEYGEVIGGFTREAAYYIALRVSIYADTSEEEEEFVPR